eukprot:11213180-Lingulodinium_polyedra.AAC.1
MPAIALWISTGRSSPTFKVLYKAWMAVQFAAIRVAGPTALRTASAQKIASASARHWPANRTPNSR